MKINTLFKDSLTSIKVDKTCVGYTLKIKNSLLFFGNQFSDFNALTHIYKDFNFLSVNQVHGIQTICRDKESLISNGQTRNQRILENRTQNNLIVADGQETDLRSTSLAVYTADCLPILMTNGDLILSIHAGWRGCLDGILKLALKSLNRRGIKGIDIVVGPHIQKDSFEVSKDLYEKFAESYESSGIHDKSNNKYYVDLSQVIISQCQSEILENNLIDSLSFINIDTFKDKDFNSYRYNKSPDRNINFITLA